MTGNGQFSYEVEEVYIFLYFEEIQYAYFSGFVSSLCRVAPFSQVSPVFFPSNFRFQTLGFLLTVRVCVIF